MKAIIVRNGSVLLVEGHDTEGSWFALPGGGQQRGERLDEAVRRECREEVGAEVRVGALRWVRDYIGSSHEFASEHPDVHQVELWFECSLVGDYEPALGTHPDDGQLGVRWAHMTELRELRIYPKILKQLLGFGFSARPTYLGDVN